MSFEDDIEVDDTVKYFFDESGDFKLCRVIKVGAEGMYLRAKIVDFEAPWKEYNVDFSSLEKVSGKIKGNVILKEIKVRTTFRITEFGSYLAETAESYEDAERWIESALKVMPTKVFQIHKVYVYDGEK